MSDETRFSIHAIWAAAIVVVAMTISIAWTYSVHEFQEGGYDEVSAPGSPNALWVHPKTSTEKQ